MGKKLSFKEALKISQDTLKKAEQERAEVAEKEAAESRAYEPKEIWIVHAFNEAMLKDFQTGGAKGKWNSTIIKNNYEFLAFTSTQVAPQLWMECSASGMIDFLLQRLWKFPQDERLHRWFELPKCTCPKNIKYGKPCKKPKFDNNCVLHGGLVTERIRCFQLEVSEVVI